MENHCGVARNVLFKPMHCITNSAYVTDCCRDSYIQTQLLLCRIGELSIVKRQFHH